MRVVVRQALSEAATEKLAALTRDVMVSPNPTARAKSLWKHKPDEFDEIRRVLVSMAHGRARCMYCEDGLGTDIEHFWPKGGYPERAFEWENYLLACGHCNSNAKRTQFPLDDAGRPILLDPSVDDPARHLRFLPATGELEALDHRGEASIEVFGLNDQDAPRRLPSGRHDALNVFVELLLDYDHYRREASPRAETVRKVLSSQSFSSVFVWLINIPKLPDGPRILGIALGARELGPVLCEIITHYDVAAWIES